MIQNTFDTTHMAMCINASNFLWFCVSLTFNILTMKERYRAREKEKGYATQR